MLMERYCMEIYRKKASNKGKTTIIIADSRQSINIKTNRGGLALLPNKKK